jgi:hypothetical protein
MFCHKCGQQNEDDSKFCPNCGSPFSQPNKSIPKSGAKKPEVLMCIIFYSSFSALIVLIMAIAFLFDKPIDFPAIFLIIFVPLWTLFRLIPLGDSVREFNLMFLPIFGILYIGIVYGLWNLSQWGRKLAIAVYGISILMVIAFFWRAGFPFPGGGRGGGGGAEGFLLYLFFIILWSPIAICAVIIFYLSRQEVKRLFR